MQRIASEWLVSLQYKSVMRNHHKEKILFDPPKKMLDTDACISAASMHAPVQHRCRVVMHASVQGDAKNIFCISAASVFFEWPCTDAKFVSIIFARRRNFFASINFFDAKLFGCGKFSSGLFFGFFLHHPEQRNFASLSARSMLGACSTLMQKMYQ